MFLGCLWGVLDFAGSGDFLSGYWSLVCWWFLVCCFAFYFDFARKTCDSEWVGITWESRVLGYLCFSGFWCECWCFVCGFWCFLGFGCLAGFGAFLDCFVGDSDLGYGLLFFGLIVWVGFIVSVLRELWFFG